MTAAKTPAAAKKVAAKVNDDTKKPDAVEPIAETAAPAADAAAPVAPATPVAPAAHAVPKAETKPAKVAPRPVESINARLAAGRNGSMDREMRPLLEAMLADQQALADAVNKLIKNEDEHIHLRVGK